MAATSSRSSNSSNKKRGRSLFEAVQKIETQDAVARTKRRASSAQVRATSSAALAQQDVYGNLLQVRILLQRALQGDMEQIAADKKEAIDKCTKLLTMLLQARQELSQKQNNGDNDDDKNPPNYKAIVKDDEKLEKQLQSEFEMEKKMWKEVLDRRHKEVRLHAGLAAKSQFRALDLSFWDQVESTVRHEQRQKSSSSSSANNEKPFDDSKIYQQLLKEFVTTHPSAEKNSAKDRLRSSSLGTRRTVNQVDRRASKGRKLRYTPIPKLANFTYPLSRPAAILDDEAWFQSLFGGAAVAATPLSAKKTPQHQKE